MPQKNKTLGTYALIQHLSVKQIHQAIRNSFTPAIAANQLDLGDVSTLTSHLGKFILDGEILSFAQFKALPVKRAQNIWGHRYNQPMIAPTIQVGQYSGAHIYHIVYQSRTVREAASKLGVREHSLRRCLNQFTYQGEMLEFDILKKCSEEQARNIFGAKFEATEPEQRSNLTPSVPMVYGFVAKSKKKLEDVGDVSFDFDSLPEVLPFSIFGTASFLSITNRENHFPLSNQVSTCGVISGV